MLFNRNRIFRSTRLIWACNLASINSNSFDFFLASLSHSSHPNDLQMLNHFEMFRSLEITNCAKSRVFEFSNCQIEAMPMHWRFYSACFYLYIALGRLCARLFVLFCIIIYFSAFVFLRSTFIVPQISSTCVRSAIASGSQIRKKKKNVNMFILA